MTDEQIQQWDNNIGPAREWDEAFRRFAAKRGLDYDRFYYPEHMAFFNRKRKEKKLNESGDTTKRDQEA